MTTEAYIPPLLANSLPAGALVWDGTSMQLPAAGNPTEYLQVSQDGSSFQITSVGGQNLLVGAAAGLQALRLWGDFIQEESVFGQTAPGGTDHQIRWVNPPNPDQVFRCARIGAIGKPEVAGNPLAPMALELGENSSGPLTTQVVARGLWIDDILFADDQDHTFEVEEARAGGNQQGKGFRFFAGPGYTGGGANVGGSITISGGPGAGGGANGAVDVNTLMTSGATTLGRAGSASATVMLAGTTTTPDLILPAGGNLVVSGSHNGVDGSWYPKTPADRLNGVPALPWRRVHAYSLGMADGIQIHADLTDTERAAIQYGSSAVFTGWHLVSSSNAAVLSTSGVGAVAGATAALVYPTSGAGYAAVLSSAGTPVVRVNGTGEFALFNATPTTQPTAVGETSGTGGIGSTVYLLGDVIRALKLLGGIAL